MLLVLITFLALGAGVGVGIYIDQQMLTPKLLKLISVTTERTAALVAATMLNPGRKIQLPHLQSTAAYEVQEPFEDEDLQQEGLETG